MLADFFRSSTRSPSRGVANLAVARTRREPPCLFRRSAAARRKPPR